MINIRKLEAELWEAADALRQGSKLTSNQYCMPVLGLIFLRYAYGRYKMVEADLLKSRPVRNGRALPIDASDFRAKSALYLPKEAQYEYLVNLPGDIVSQNLKGRNGQALGSLGEVVNNAMDLVEEQSEQLKGILPKNYTIFRDELLAEILRIFNNSALDEVGGDVIGRIYEYFLNKFAKNVAQDDGVFFTPKSLVKMIVNVLEPSGGILLDPACGSGGMFVQTGDFVESEGMSANSTMTFYGQEKVEYNAQLCLMNMAVHGLSGSIKSGDDANSFYHDAHNLAGECDYVMANPPFNVDKVKSESCISAGRLPFGLPGINKDKEFGNANYLWISYFYAYLNEKGRAGFVMASSATDSQGKDRDIREKLVKTGDVDVMISVSNNFFYTKSLPCTLWFFNKGKKKEIKDKVLFIDARNYYTVVDRTLNEWSEWQLKNLNAIVWLYRGEVLRYKKLVNEYKTAIWEFIEDHDNGIWYDTSVVGEEKQSFQDYLNALNILEIGYKKVIKDLQDDLKVLKKRDEKADCKKAIAGNEVLLEETQAMQIVMKEAIWLTDKFGEGEYHDVEGLCKIADTSIIEEKGWSLTPGAYVGVAAVEDDGVDFKERMTNIHLELAQLNTDANRLMETIQENWKSLGL